MASSLSYFRLISDSDGESHFVPLNIEMTTRHFAPPAPSFDVSVLESAEKVGFLRVPKGWIGDLHPTPTRMWVFFLSGEMEFEATDGEIRPGVPGKAFLLEDTTGKGHLSRVVGSSDAVLAVVQV
ncbi:MAG TPA: hypothetical protein VFK48_18970 [Usitatibacter sp.]|nr:hypothetical protein [Usitatibacter sp.]